MSGAALVSAAALAPCASAKPADPAAQGQTPARTAPTPSTLGPFPKWSDFPRGPQPTPPPAEIASRVAAVQEAQADLLNAAAGLQWTLSGTAAFAEAARSEINPEYAAPAPADSAAQIESMVKALREQAAPPPPPASSK